MIIVRRLVWEKNNIDHIARHQVVPEEVEEVCHNNPVILKGHSGRLVIIGLTYKGRALSVVLDPESEKDVYYPVTARSADRKERKYYKDQGGNV